MMSSTLTRQWELGYLKSNEISVNVTFSCARTVTFLTEKWDLCMCDLSCFALVQPGHSSPFCELPELSISSIRPSTAYSAMFVCHKVAMHVKKGKRWQYHPLTKRFRRAHKHRYNWDSVLRFVHSGIWLKKSLFTVSWTSAPCGWDTYWIEYLCCYTWFHLHVVRAWNRREVLDATTDLRVDTHFKLDQPQNVISCPWPHCWDFLNIS